MPSKITFHINGFDSKVFDLLSQMQPTVVKVYDFPSDSNIDEIRNRCPNTLIVYRHYVAWDAQTEWKFTHPVQGFVDKLQDPLNKLKGRGIIWEGVNEPIIATTQDAQTLNDWFVRFADLMHAKGEKVAAFSFSTGNPVNLDLVPLLEQAALKCDYIALHEYHHPVAGSGQFTRYRQFRAKLSVNARKPIIITECGVDNGQNQGWQAFMTADQYTQLLAGYDTELLKNNYLIGATLFQYGGGGEWKTFDVALIGKKIADYVTSQGGGGNPPGDGDTVTTPSQLEQAIITEAKKRRWMPINDTAALYQFAQENNLGYPQTDEFKFVFNNQNYIGQVYNLGIVYVKEGDWGNPKWTKKP